MCISFFCQARWKTKSLCSTHCECKAPSPNVRCCVNQMCVSYANNQIRTNLLSQMVLRATLLCILLCLFSIHTLSLIVCRSFVRCDINKIEIIGYDWWLQPIKSAKPQQQQQTQQRWQQWKWQWSQDKGTKVWEKKVAINLIVQFPECYHFIFQRVYRLFYSQPVLTAECLLCQTVTKCFLALSNHSDFSIPIYQRNGQTKT